jgi:AFG3 family protein
VLTKNNYVLLFFGNVTTGASDDLRRVTQMVYSTIKDYGMNSRVGQLSFPRNESGMPADKPYSDATAQAIDEEARSIVDAAYQRTLDLIRERKTEVEQVALRLLERETITHDDIVDLVGPRPFEGDEQYKQYVSSRHVVDQSEPAMEEEEKKEEDLTDGVLPRASVIRITHGFRMHENYYNYDTTGSYIVY